MAPGGFLIMRIDKVYDDANRHIKLLLQTAPLSITGNVRQNNIE